jgi:hypothetical protein
VIAGVARRIDRERSHAVRTDAAASKCERGHCGTGSDSRSPADRTNGPYRTTDGRSGMAAKCHQRVPDLRDFARPLPTQLRGPQIRQAGETLGPADAQESVAI